MFLSPDVLDDHVAVIAGVLGDLAHGCFQSAAEDVYAGLLVRAIA
jgi:hypothetical protein